MLNKTSFILFVLILLTPRLTAQEKTEKDIYLQLYSVREDISKDFENTIAEVAKIGYRGVEAARYSDGRFYGLSPAEFKKQLNDVGLQVLSSHTGKQLPDDVSKTDWDKIWKWWEQAIDAHKAAGIEYIVTAWMPKPKTLADLKVYCDYYNQIGEKCNVAGLKFGYHNHDFEFTKIENELMYDYMLKNTDPQKVFFQMDVFWTVYAQKSPVEYFNKYPGRFELLHIKDKNELGQSGMVGFDAIFKNIATAGTKYIIVEVENYTYKPLESVKVSFEYLKNLLCTPKEESSEVD